MISIRNVIDNNTKTFHNHRLDAHEPIGQRLLATGGIAFLLALFTGSNISDFLDAVITVQAILIGFSFSVMFFLVSEDVKPATVETGSIEAARKAAQANRVAGEIFHNVSYYNLVAMLCLGLALVLLVPARIFTVPDFLAPLYREQPMIGDFLNASGKAGRFVMLAAFYFLLLESAFTFSRSIARVSFLFEQKIRPGR